MSTRGIGRDGAVSGGWGFMVRSSAVVLLCLGLVTSVAAQGDSCVDAESLPLYGPAAFDLTGFTVEGPTDCVTGATADGWFIYTAVVSGLLRFDTCSSTGPSANTAITVYDGVACPIEGHPFLGCSAAGCGPAGLHGSVTIPVGAGDSFYLRVSWIGADPGVGVLDVTPVPPPSEDCLGPDDCDSVFCAETPCFTYSGETDLIIDYETVFDVAGLVPDGVLLEDALSELGVSVLRLEYMTAYLMAADLITSGQFERIWVVGGTGAPWDWVTTQGLMFATRAGTHVYLSSSTWYAAFGASLYGGVDGVDHVLSVPGEVPVLSVDGVDSGLGFNFGAYQDVPLTPDDIEGDPHDLLVLATDDAEVASVGSFFAPDDSLGLGDYSVVLGAQLFSGVRTIASSIEVGSFPPEIRTQVVAGYYAFLGGESSAPSVRRGDANDDGNFDVCDVVFTLEALFLEGTSFHCEDAADANDDEALDLADPIYSATALFMSGALPPSPGPFGCGVDPSGRELGCDASLICW